MRTLTTLAADILAVRAYFEDFWPICRGLTNVAIGHARGYIVIRRVRHTPTFVVLLRN